MVEQILQKVTTDMQKVLESCLSELGKVRTGRAHAGLVDQLKVDYYGVETPIKTLANVVVSDAKTITITPWEPHLVKSIEKVIRTADLGLNPIGEANLVRVSVPALNAERRQELVKIVKNIAETFRVAVRNVRRDAITSLRETLKKKELDEDSERRTQEEVQKITDRFIQRIDKAAQDKGDELLKV